MTMLLIVIALMAIGGVLVLIFGNPSPSGDDDSEW